MVVLLVIQLSKKGDLDWGKFALLDITRLYKPGQIFGFTRGGGVCWNIVVLQTSNVTGNLLTIFNIKGNLYSK